MKIIFIIIAICVWTEWVDLSARLSMLDTKMDFKNYIDRYKVYANYAKRNFSGWEKILAYYIHYKFVLFEQIGEMTKFKQ